MERLEEITSLQAEIKLLKENLQLLEGKLQHLLGQPTTPSTAQSNDVPTQKWPLSNAEYKRYGRQLILPQIGLQGQLRLKGSSILIVGAGGLGCPAAAYLAGAGVGTIGIIDGDFVEESNLHRQILHSTATVGESKVDSATRFLRKLNPEVAYVPHRKRLAQDNVFGIFQSYDIVLDCTDTPASRYLISDACVILQKPLVSASALRTEGQLMVLNYPARPPGDIDGGPCYRCIFPRPPPADSVLSCGEGGILGPVVGVMGVLQALEAIKLVIDQTSNEESLQPSMLLFSAYSSPQFRSIRMRRRKITCAACSSQATVSKESLGSGSMDYVQFCGSVSPVNLLTTDERITAKNFAAKEANVDAPVILIDTRDRIQYDLCHLRDSQNIPIEEFTSGSTDESNKLNQRLVSILGTQSPDTPIILVCRLGNDSQVAVRRLKQLGLDASGQRWIGDMKGGLRAWRDEVDSNFPDY